MPSLEEAFANQPCRRLRSQGMRYVVRLPAACIVDAVVFPAVTFPALFLSACNCLRSTGSRSQGRFVRFSMRRCTRWKGSPPSHLEPVVAVPEGTFGVKQGANNRPERRGKFYTSWLVGKGQLCSGEGDGKYVSAVIASKVTGNNVGCSSWVGGAAMSRTSPAGSIWRAECGPTPGRPLTVMRSYQT